MAPETRRRSWPSLTREDGWGEGDVDSRDEVRSEGPKELVVPKPPRLHPESLADSDGMVLNRGVPSVGEYPGILLEG